MVEKIPEAAFREAIANALIHGYGILIHTSEFLCLMIE